jgi:hypothetical protein
MSAIDAFARHYAPGVESAHGTAITTKHRMDLYTKIHVIISLVGIVSGLVVLVAMMMGSDRNGWTSLFLVSTVATSLTGFGFPINGFTPALAFGVLSLVLLAAAIAARYALRLAGHWRWVFVVGAVVALYLNVFVLVVQSFLKIPALNALAPTGTEAPFAIAQGIVLVLFVCAGILAVRRYPRLPAAAIARAV